MMMEQNYDNLQHRHMWGCPVYILEYDAVVGKKIPKWSLHAYCGINLGASAAHLSNVLLVLSIKLGLITPQYHVVFDDCFSMTALEAVKPQVCETLFSYSTQSWDQFDDDKINSEPSRLKREDS
mmetsp:Transcript_5784/g.8453  ORF Transcript_5784/g.8453 Transcript_5784/m.8453 type:complete len:124 (+) Transcript_5784:431-802(+)